MSTKTSRFTPISAMIAGSALLMLSGAGVGHADPLTADDVAVPAYEKSQAEKTSPKVKRQVEAGIEKVKKSIAEAGEGKIVSISSEDYVFKDRKTNEEMQAQDYPANCAFVAIQYFDENADSHSFVHNSTLTECDELAVNIDHQLDLTQWTFGFPSWIQTELGYTVADTSLYTVASIECETANESTFSSNSRGAVVLTDAVGTATDEAEDTYPCRAF